MALFRNLGVKLRGCLCDVPRYASAQPLVFLDLAENCSFLNWKLTLVPIEFFRFLDGHLLSFTLSPHPADILFPDNLLSGPLSPESLLLKCPGAFQLKGEAARSVFRYCNRFFGLGSFFFLLFWEWRSSKIANRHMVSHVYEVALLRESYTCLKSSLRQNCKQHRDRGSPLSHPLCQFLGCGQIDPGLS